MQNIVSQTVTNICLLFHLFMAARWKKSQQNIYQHSAETSGKRKTKTQQTKHRLQIDAYQTEQTYGMPKNARTQFSSNNTKKTRINHKNMRINMHKINFRTAER